MICACGTEPEYAGESRPENGNVCLTCATFTCSACFNDAPPSSTGFRDPSLCISCNNAPLEAAA